jgi:putative transposase
MQLVEQHVLDQQDARYAVIDTAAFASKNLYNAALYLVRHSFIHQGIYLSYPEVYHQMKVHEAYRFLPTKVSQQVMKLLDKNWKSYFAACKAYAEDPGKFLGHPKLPQYKDKQKGRNILVYTSQAISRSGLKRGVIVPSGLPVEIETQHASTVDCVRIVPRHGYYVVEVVYEQERVPAPLDTSLYAAIDIGLNNLAMLTSNKVGFVPRLVNGRPVKSINQFYNKQREHIQKQLGKTQQTSRRMEHLTNKRTRKIDHYLHNASKRIVELLVHEQIGTLVIGKNINWKQEMNTGKRNNQNFVQVPHARFISMLTYKCKLVGIRVIETEESYTSKASFLDMDDMPTYGECKQEPLLSGRRVKRGLYQSAEGYRYNADVNGSYNILRKVAPDAFGQGSRGCVVHPLPLRA